MRFPVLPFTFALLLSGTAVCVADTGGFKQFQSWQVSCSQSRDCTIRQFLTGSAIGQLELRRDGGPDTPLSIAASTDNPAFSEDARDVSASVSVDGGAPLSVSSGAIRYDAAAAVWVLTGNFIGSGLAMDMKNGTSLHVRLSRGEAIAEGDVPLAGVAASLLFMDDQQKRVGHTDALSARGDKPPSPALPFRDIRSLAQLPEAIRSRFAEGGECADTEESQFDGNAFVHRLSDDEAIYGTPCGTPGAYNTPFALFIDSFGVISTMAFPVLHDGAPSTMANAYNLDYDFANGTLSAFFRGRGIGDCGLYTAWHLSKNQAGAVLVLDRQTFKDCDGKDLGGPENWPAQWPLK
ncbi:DUF1176 domain-containing protein [Rhizobium sp. CG5]|uniref:DUF1176 domain-containing protein n=1 Tax=Rhizobium sp. CG5 TaxID=2726076 RepID=UPI002033493E|nr:DUF1176 domain-containing protein [Rhizobium sp. CG5]MCM2472686.1 DUF1176 domain-containing protein [Rhizobium sp. CG5]